MPYKGYTIIDGDGHVIEDTKAIINYMPQQYRDKFDTHPFFNPFPPLDHLHSANMHDFPPGAFNKVGPAGWVDFLEDVGIEKTVLYTTLGLAFGKIVSRDWAIDVARGYNDWIYNTYMKFNPRFQAMGLLPLQEPAEAAQELRRCIKELGMCGAMLPSTGIQSHLGDARYWPIYEEANNLGCAIGIHGGAHENLGMDDLTPYAPVHALGHPFGQMISFAGIVFNGVFDKYPNVKFGFMEGGVAWTLMCLERFDRSWETHIQRDPRKRFLDLKPKEKVCEYIARHVDAGRIFVGCEGEELSIGEAVRITGNKPYLFSTDYPHEVDAATCKHELEELRENRELKPADKDAILLGNSKRFYQLSLS